MVDDPHSVEAQLRNRVRDFLQATQISQRQLCRLIGTDPGNFNAYLAGCKSLSREKMAKLLQVISLNRLQLEAKLGKATTAQIAHFQQNGTPMRLSYSGSVARTGPDPNDGDIFRKARSARLLQRWDECHKRAWRDFIAASGYSPGEATNHLNHAELESWRDDIDYAQRWLNLEP